MDTKSIVINEQDYLLTDILDSEEILTVEQLEMAVANKNQYICVVGVDYIDILEQKPIAKTSVVVDKLTDGKLMFCVFDTLTETDLQVIKDTNLELSDYQFYIVQEQEEESATKEVVQDLIDMFKEQEDDDEEDFEDDEEDEEEEELEESFDGEEYEPEDYLFEPSYAEEEEEENALEMLVEEFRALSEDDQVEFLKMIFLEDEDFEDDEIIVEEDPENPQEPEYEEVEHTDEFGYTYTLLQEVKHQSAKSRIRAKLRRKNPKTKLALKKRRNRNKTCPPGTAWSSKTNSCRVKDPKKQIQAKRAAQVRFRG